MKTCSKCGEVKAVADFHKHVGKRDGLQSNCKACVKHVYARYRAAHADKIKESSVRYYAENREAVNARCATWRKNNPEKVKESTSIWRAANVDKVKAAAAAWNKANKDKVRARRAKWKAANPEKEKLGYARWAAANLEAKRIKNHNRRARKLESGGTLSKGLAAKLFKLQRGKCACGCKQPLGTDYHMDHMMPLALGGTNTDDNMQLLTATCNLQKSARHPVDFMQQRGFLL